MIGKNLVLTGLISLCSMFFIGCKTTSYHTNYVDVLIHGGQVYVGDGSEAQQLDVAICGEKICGLFQPNSASIAAKKVIDASGKVVSPGFIDPHTHSLDDLLNKAKNHNLNYLTQGVTTVVNGNDGEGPVDLKTLSETLRRQGIGTNVAFFVGHGTVRNQVMGKAQRQATDDELAQMQVLVADAMKTGALGLSSGLYYVPGSFAHTNEVIALAKTAAQYGGIYDTHIRDEGAFSIGLLPAIQEAIDIAKQANIHLHLAHIKALGADVWGTSKPIVELIKSAQADGVSISADQYPWLASGTKLHSALMPKWAMADSISAFHQRLNDPELTEKIRLEVADNLRRRGGAESILITAFSDYSIVGLTLAQLAKKWQLAPVDTAIKLVQQGEIRIASFNMSAPDVEHFMKQDWVVTSSDGTDGHPRKYASFPQKLSKYVIEDPLLTLAQYIYRSSGLTAKYLKLKHRGLIAQDYFADVLVFDPEKIKVNASYSQWAKLSEGMDFVIVNGEIVISQGVFSGRLAGNVVN